MQLKLHVPHVAAVVRELLENVNAVGVDMAAILEGAKIGSVGTLPRQHDLVGIVGITHLGIGGQCRRVGGSHGAVAVTALDTADIHGSCLVDLAQASLSHADGHNVLCIIIGHGEFAGILGPCSDLVSTASILKELDDHIVLFILDTFGHGIDVSILAESGCLGGDGGQRTDDLIVHRVTDRGGRSMLVTVLDVGQTASILTSGVLGLTHGLVESRIAGLILGVDGDIVVPCRAVNSGHGQGHKEGIAGACHVFGNASLHDEVKPLLQLVSGGVAGGIRFCQGNAAVPYGGFQSVLHGGGIGSQRSGQLVVEHITGKEVNAILGLVGVCGGQADSRQHGVGALGVVEAIQHTYRALAVHHFIAHGDIGNTEVGELHALDGVLCQLVNNGIVMQPSADVGLSIPRAVAACLGDVVLVDRKGCLFAGVDGRLGKCRGDEAQCHNSGHEQREYAMDLFHLVFSLSIIFELSFLLFTGTLVVSI